MRLSFKIKYVIEVLSEKRAQDYLPIATIGALKDILRVFLEFCDTEEEELYIPGDIMYRYKNLVVLNASNIFNVSYDCSSYINQFYCIFETHRQSCILNKLGEYIKQARVNKNLTIPHLASLLCIPSYYIEDIENGTKIELDYFQIVELANILEITPNKIWEIFK